MNAEDEKKLIKLGEEQERLVRHLKESLLLGQMGFLKAAKFLYEIKTKQTFIGEDLSHPWTWEDFISRPDLPIPGRTKESRARTASALIRIYKFYQIDKGLDSKEIAEIGWHKLDLIVRACEEESDEEVIKDWIERARTLTVPDLQVELKLGDKSFSDRMNCDHGNVVHEWRCKDCGTRSKDKLK